MATEPVPVGKLIEGDAQRDAVHVDPEPIRKQIREAQDRNRKFLENKRRAEVAAKLTESRAKQDQLTKEIDALDEQKKSTIAAAQFPIPNLSLSDESVLYNNLPLEQAASSEQTKVSVAIGLALNPKLKVLLVRDGSLLDDNSLRMVGEMAAAADAQVWIERVSKDEKCQVIIENGEVAEVRPQAATLFA